MYNNINKNEDSFFGFITGVLFGAFFLMLLACVSVTDGWNNVLAGMMITSGVLSAMCFVGMYVSRRIADRKPAREAKDVCREFVVCTTNQGMSECIQQIKNQSHCYIVSGENYGLNSHSKYIGHPGLFVDDLENTIKRGKYDTLVLTHYDVLVGWLFRGLYSDEAYCYRGSMLTILKRITESAGVNLHVFIVDEEVYDYRYDEDDEDDGDGDTIWADVHHENALKAHLSFEVCLNKEDYHWWESQ